MTAPALPGTLSQTGIASGANHDDAYQNAYGQAHATLVGECAILKGTLQDESTTVNFVHTYPALRGTDNYVQINLTVQANCALPDSN
jgi:hypothetical protein